MSQWRYKCDGQVTGPISFQELAGLIRNGTLGESARVCRADAMNWQPAWQVPGLYRAAGIVESGDSTVIADSDVAQAGGQGALPRVPSYVPPEVRPAPLTMANVVRATIATAAGMLAIAFFYNWARHTTLAFPLPPLEVDGEIIDSYFPLLGRCTSLECCLLYLDMFTMAAIGGWRATARLGPMLTRGLS